MFGWDKSGFIDWDKIDYIDFRLFEVEVMISDLGGLIALQISLNPHKFEL